MIASLARDPFLRQLDRMRPRVPRSYRQFAEEEIVMPDGPFKGWNYSCDRMPFTAELLDEFSRGRFRYFYGSGPAQGSKTLHFCVIPTLYHLLEINEGVIFGAPTIVMAKAAFEARIRPAIEASDRYRDLLPTKGGGSRGGVADYIRLKNGALIRFLGAGGGDQQLSGYTSRIVVATELDKMDEPGQVSRETDPVSKLMARTGAFGDRARFFGECTMSTKGGRIYREVVELGTDSRVHLPCPHCRQWIYPERAGLVGWSQAVDEMAAREATRFECPSCHKQWTEEQRKQALRNPRIVARDQRVLDDGTVDGPMPKTLTYGFRWNAISSPLKEMADIGAKEWRAERSGVTSEEKELRQFEWVIPWEENTEDLNRPDVAVVLQKISNWPRKVIPPDTVRLTMGVDVGSYVVWYVLMAWFKDGRGHIVDWDGITVNNPDGVKNRMHVLAALRDLRERVIKPGWGARGADHALGAALGRQPEKVICDAGYESDVVYAFVLESGEPRYLASKGCGSNKDTKWSGQQAQEPNKGKVVDQEWRSLKQPAGVRLILHHSDYWKARIHDGLHAGMGGPGSITIPEGNIKELRYLARQLVAEERTMKAVAGHEAKVVWVQKHSQNHWLDCAAMACCGADIEGVKVVRPAIVPLRRPAGRPSDAQLDVSRLKRVRTKY